jgi:hypothetical protein
LTMTVMLWNLFLMQRIYLPTLMIVKE